MGSALFTLMGKETNVSPNSQSTEILIILRWSLQGAHGLTPCFYMTVRADGPSNPPSPLAGALIGERQGTGFKTTHVATSQ